MIIIISAGALRRDLDVLNKIPASPFLIPARLDDCKVPKRFAEIKYVDLFLDWETGLNHILKALGLVRQ